MVMLSIIVPVFNKVHYIDECIQSILAQTFTEFELILINDGSTDGSGDKCLHYAAQDSRIMVIEQTNKGVSAARNAGLAQASGKYIGFVDSDDTIAPDMYAILLKNARDRQAEISSCRLRTLKDGRASRPLTPAQPVLYNQSDAISAFFNGAFDFNVNNKIYKASLLDNLFFEGTMYEDILFVCQALLKANLAVVENAAKYNYIIRNNSVSMGSFGKAYFETAAVSASMVTLVAANEPKALPQAKAFDVMANLSLLNLLLLLKDRSAYSNEYIQIVARLYSYHSFIKSSAAVRSKHRYAWLFFTISPSIYAYAMRLFCRLTRSDAIKRTQQTL